MIKQTNAMGNANMNHCRKLKFPYFGNICSICAAKTKFVGEPTLFLINIYNVPIPPIEAL